MVTVALVASYLPALRASRGRLARQLLIESLIFAVLGGIGGLVIAQWTGQALVAQLSTPVQQIVLDLSFDWRVLAFTAAVALVTASMFGTVPAFRSTRIAQLANEGKGSARMAMHAIRAGEGDVFVAAGVETVSRFVMGTSDMPKARPGDDDRGQPEPAGEVEDGEGELVDEPGTFDDRDEIVRAEQSASRVLPPGKRLETPHGPVRRRRQRLERQ